MSPPCARSLYPHITSSCPLPATSRIQPLTKEVHVVCSSTSWAVKLEDTLALRGSLTLKNVRPLFLAVRFSLSELLDVQRKSQVTS